MIKSSPILPIRFYDDLFDQHRFNIHSEKADQIDLVYPAHELPHFQITRDKSLNTCSKFYLRKVCTDLAYHYGYFKQIPVPADVFSTFAAENFYSALPEAGGVFDDGVNPPSGGVEPIAKYECNKLVNLTVDPSWTFSANGEFSFPLTGHPDNYTFKIIVDKLKIVNTSTFNIKIYTGGSAGTLIGTITEPGIYTYNFTSAGPDVTLVFDDYQPGDLFEISYMQAMINIFDTIQTATDVVLSAASIKIKPMLDGTDRLVYCDPTTSYFTAFGSTPSPGHYYYIVQMGTDEFYFSEVFRIVSLRDIEKYYKLKWYNDCDINNAIIYDSAVLACDYYNTVYLDAALFRPEPDTTEAGEEDKNGDVNVTFRAWKKYISLEILKSPEFLSDALSAVFLHSSVYLKRPLNINQQVNTNEYLVRKVVPDVTNVMSDHFQKVNLKLMIEDTLSTDGCCTSAELFSCNPETYVAAATCTGDYQLIMTGPPASGDGLYDCSTGLLIEVNEDDIILYNSKYYKLALVGGIWQPSVEMPSITNVSAVGSNQVVTGYVIPHSFARLQYSFNGGAWTTHSTVAAGSDGSYSISFPTSLMSGAVDFDIRVQSLSLNCNFGLSDVEDLV